MTTRLHDPAWQRSLAFFAGLSFAAVPALGPFLALLAMATGRLELHRADRWWWLAAFLLGAPLALTTDLLAAVAASAQVIAAWLIFRCATEVRHRLKDAPITLDVGLGLVVGLAITLLLGLRQFDGFSWETARTALDAITWQAHPAIFGHTMLVLSALLAVVVPNAGLRALALALGAVGVVLSGSREAMFAWLVVAVGLRFVGRRGNRATNLVEWLQIVLMLLLASGALSSLGVGRTGFLTEVTRASDNPNVFRGTEVAEADWWYPLGVDVAKSLVVVDGAPRNALAVSKTWTEPWARLQQVVTLQPGETYTLSAAWRPSGAAAPGFDGWGRQAGAEEDSVLSSTMVNGVHRAAGSGDIAVLTAGSLELDGGFTRGFVTFRHAGERPLIWYVGVVPDRSNVAGGMSTFAELQLTASSSLLEYRPGLAERGVGSLEASRLPVWRDALAAIAAEPLLGWGTGGLPAAMEELREAETRVRPIAAHAHNMLLAVWVDRGLLGAIGLLALFVLLALRAVQQRDRAMAVVLAGVLLLNVFDATLFSGGVLYPLAAVLGWRAVGRRQVATSETGVGSAAVVRLALAAGDAAAGAAAISAALLVTSALPAAEALATGWSAPLVYATLLWPLVGGWSGLYPGYGRPAHEELGRSVATGAGAVLLLAFLSLALPSTLALGAGTVLVSAIASPVLTPLFRALAKEALKVMRLWGRPVAILGTGPAAERTARHLLDHPGVGLHPQAVFGTGDGWELARLPVTGALDSVWSYLARTNVRHVIVTAGAAKELEFDEVLRRSGALLKHVQYLPDLGGLPTSSVVAAPLGTSLALEVRNQLASATNRTFKRLVDVAFSAAALAVLALPLTLIGLLVRLDSPGGALHLSPRVGRDGRVFRCIKFRTMHQDAQARLERLLEDDPSLRTEYDRYRKLTPDPRVTRMGRVLRRLSLDELPQLLNVLRGDMSVVGPRPYLVTELDAMGPDRDLIFLARPGLTGYWQVTARNDVDFDERQAMEAHYVRNWSFWWDVEIMLRTPQAMLQRHDR